MKIAIKSCFTTLVEDTTLIQNAATPYPVEFAFSKDWDGFAKTALFEAGGVSMAVVLSEDKCDIPGECLKKGGIPLTSSKSWSAGKKDSAKQVAELAELVAAGLEDLQHIGISVTLPAANWSGGAQTVAHASLLADSNYIYLVGADAGTRNVYDNYGVSADNVTTSGQMTFRCDTTPTVDLSVFIIRLEVGTDE